MKSPFVVTLFSIIILGLFFICFASWMVEEIPNANPCAQHVAEIGFYGVEYKYEGGKCYMAAGFVDGKQQWTFLKDFYSGQ